MSVWSLLLLAAVAAATKSGYYPHPLQCYQCAYSKPDIVSEEIQVPRIEYEDIQVPRVVVDDVEVPRVVYDVAQVPRVVEEVVAPSKKAYYAGYHPVVRMHLVYDTVTTSRTVVDVVQVSRTVYDTEQVSKTVYDTEVITKTTPGGWDKCGSSFTHEEAEANGVDVWECHENCYTRLEGDNLFRGCYKGEYAVDPHQLGCHQQNGATWCFCKGALCNNAAAP